MKCRLALCNVLALTLYFIIQNVGLLKLKPNQRCKVKFMQESLDMNTLQNK